MKRDASSFSDLWIATDVGLTTEGVSNISDTHGAGWNCGPKPGVSHYLLKGSLFI